MKRHRVPKSLLPASQPIAVTIRKEYRAEKNLATGKTTFYARRPTATNEPSRFYPRPFRRAQDAADFYNKRKASREDPQLFARRGRMVQAQILAETQAA